jgi:acetone carboxylase gamma subunit
MKRAGGLFESLCDYANIREAFLSSLRNKRYRASALIFCKNTDEHLERARRRLLSADIQWSPYKQFVITDPKLRVISAAPFEDR